MNKGGSESVGSERRIQKGRRFDPFVLEGVGGRNSLPSTQINFKLKLRISFFHFRFVTGTEKCFAFSFPEVFSHALIQYQLNFMEVHPMADFEFTITESDSLVDLEEYIDYCLNHGDSNPRH